MFRLLYELTLHLYAFVKLPKLIWKRQPGRPLSSWFRAKVETSSKPTIWVHAVSVGEARAIGGLVRHIKAVRPDVRIIFSSVTATGHAEVMRSIPEADAAIYLPIDFSYIIRPLVKRLQPRSLIICETDYWFNFLDAVKQQGGQVAVVNGKLSQRTARRYHRFPWLPKRIFQLVDHICVQSDIYAQRIADIDVPSDKVTVTGNLKYDAVPQPLADSALHTLCHQLKLGKTDRVITVGSTHDPEEQELLEALLPVEQAKILLVPRHPERFDDIAKLLTNLDIPWGRYSASDTLTGEERVVLIDAMGILNDCYQLSDVAIVAGSFGSKVGGHNILEPIWFGVPTLFGPHMEQQPEMTELVVRYGAGMQVRLADLATTVRELLTNTAKRDQFVEGGKLLLSSVEGSLQRTWNALQEARIYPCGKL